MKKKKILIIDDDRELCTELSEMLNTEGFHADCISDSRQWEQSILAETYDIVILDFRMPYLTGVDILKLLRQKKNKIEIIMMTGRPFIENILKEEKVDNMIKGIVAKPLNLKDLLKKLRT